VRPTQCTVTQTRTPTLDILLHVRVYFTKLLCPHHEGAGGPHPIRVGWPDLWYQMVLVDTTVEQSLASSAGGTRGREYVC
jgi:hypothetical protein